MQRSVCRACSACRARARRPGSHPADAMWPACGSLEACAICTTHFQTSPKVAEGRGHVPSCEAPSRAPVGTPRSRRALPSRTQRLPRRTAAVRPRRHSHRPARPRRCRTTALPPTTQREGRPAAASRPAALPSASARSCAQHRAPPALDLFVTAHAAIIPSRRSRHVPPPRDAPSRCRRAHPAGEQAAVRALPDQVPAGVGDVQEGRSQLLDRGGDRPCGEPRPAATPPGHRPGHRLLGRRAAPRGGARLPSSRQPLEAPPSRVRATPSPARA